MGYLFFNKQINLQILAFSRQMSIPGSKPKKFWRKPNNNNPTFSSYNMNSVLVDPQAHVLYQKKINVIDSLQAAQKQFVINKSAISRNNSLLISRKQQHLSDEVYSKSPSTMRNKYDPKQIQSISMFTRADMIFPDEPKNQHYRKLNLLDSKGIQKKQLHAYNILSGY